MMYSAYKLNKQGDNIQPWRTPFPIWNQSVGKEYREKNYIVIKESSFLIFAKFFFGWQAMATHSSTLAWKISGTEEPSGLPSVGLHRVGHNWSDLAAAAAVIREKLKIVIF